MIVIVPLHESFGVYLPVCYCPIAVSVSKTKLNIASEMVPSDLVTRALPSIPLWKSERIT
jgi:hypothetical protein